MIDDPRPFRCRLADEATPEYFNLQGVPGLTGWISRQGRRVLKFPPPFDDIEIAEDEHVGRAKTARVREAIRVLTQE